MSLTPDRRRYFVVSTTGGVMLRGDGHQGVGKFTAQKDAFDRNVRARELGIKTRYKIKLVTEWRSERDGG